MQICWERLESASLLTNGLIIRCSPKRSRPPSAPAQRVAARAQGEHPEALLLLGLSRTGSC